MLVCVFPLGIAGAALATVISQFISVLLCGIHAYRTNPYFHIKREDICITLRMTSQVVRLGVPMSIQFALIAISAMALQRVVNSFGTTVVAAFTATNRIEQLIHQPYMTLTASLSIFCGQNYGAKRNDRVYAGYRTGIMIMISFSVFLIFAMQLFGEAITRLFVSDQEVVMLGARGLKITSMFYLALGMIYVVRGVLTGIGDAFFSLFNGVVEVIGRFTVPLLLTSYFGYGETGIWLSTGIVWLISGVTAWIRYLTYFRSRVELPSGSASHYSLRPLFHQR